MTVEGGKAGIQVTELQLSGDDSPQQLHHHHPSCADTRTVMVCFDPSIDSFDTVPVVSE